MIELTTDSLARMLGREIPDAHLLVAKNSVMGLDSHGIADLLGVGVEEVKGIEDDPEFREVRLIVAAKHNEGSIQKDLSWDALEEGALKNLMKRIDYETDVETNLRIAMIANRAQRRHQSPMNRVLDARDAQGTVQLTLTNRIIERLTNRGPERETTQQLSIKNGSASNPSFSEIDEALGVTARPRIAENISFRTYEPEVDQDSLNQLMLGKKK